MKIVVLDGYTLNPGDLEWRKLEDIGELTVYDRTAKEDIVARIGNAEAVFTNKTPLGAAELDACPGIKFIGVLATGYNVVDVAAAKEQGIIVTNVPTYATQAVAQFVFALLLDVCHRARDHSHSVMNGEWESSKDFCYWKYPLMELYGKTMGLIGYGRIGQATAKIAKAMGMNVIAYDENHIPGIEDESMRYAPLEDLFSESDVISLHCPMLPSTEKIINEANINKMKDGVIIINTSRGGLVDEKALADALNSGKVYASCCDVVSVEPIHSDNPLLKAKNILITPHIAWAPKEARLRLMSVAAENLKAFMSGIPVNVVS